MLETNNHFTPELLICVPGDLTTNNIAYTARLIECERPTLFGQYGNFFYLFIYFSSRVQDLLVLGYCPSPC